MSVKVRVRNSGAGNGCANFMDAWKKASVLQEKMSIKFLVLGGGGILGFFGGGGGGGGSADFIFMGARIFLKYDRAKVPPYNGNDHRSPLVV